MSVSTFKAPLFFVRFQTSEILTVISEKILNSSLTRLYDFYSQKLDYFLSQENSNNRNVISSLITKTFNIHVILKIPRRQRFIKQIKT